MGHSFVQGCVGVFGLSESSKSLDLSLNLSLVTEAEFFKYFSSYAGINLLKGENVVTCSVIFLACSSPVDILVLYFKIRLIKYLINIFLQLFS